ncbi:MAG: hypothetical protein K5773_09185 [Pseudobutyrivibrio sp.]|nr:hypothetical protein [Pseudobutyrivibrio sp.]
MFVGRNAEIKALNGFFEKKGAGLAVVSGSYGVGKTELLKEFSKDKESFYFDAYETTAKHLSEILGGMLGLKTACSADLFCQEILNRADSQKQLVILDQYPNIVKADPDFNKTLLSYFNGKWKNKPIKLVLCGDAFSLMEKYVYGSKAAWNPNISLHLSLNPLGFYDSCQFFMDASPSEAAYLYGISGGYPYNLIRIAGMMGHKDFSKYSREIGENRLKDITSGLYLDKETGTGLKPETIMSQELRELSYYNHLLVSLAKGIYRVNQISAEVEKPKDVVVPYLNSLMGIGICRKETAVTEITNRKKTRYSIANLNTLFWYMYIVENYEDYIQGNIDLLWNKIEQDLDKYMERVFIQICGEYLQDRSDKNLLPFTVEVIGNWWVNDEEKGTSDGFDLVSLGKCEGKSATIYCQCYYNDAPIEVAQLKVLIEKTKQLHRQGDAFYIVFSKAGFNENAITISSAIKNIMLITLDEMR